jgi:hypothetical protein
MHILRESFTYIFEFKTLSKSYKHGDTFPYINIKKSYKHELIKDMRDV